MEKIELVEKLVSTFGVSYAKAKEALEACGWDAVDAAVYLEKEKQAEEKSEEKCCEEHKKGVKGSFNIPVDEMKESGNSCFKTCWDFFSKNTVVVKKSTGELFLEIPIWLAVILLCAFFWAIFFVVGILFVMGYRFSVKPHTTEVACFHVQTGKPVFPLSVLNNRTFSGTWTRCPSVRRQPFP